MSTAASSNRRVTAGLIVSLSGFSITVNVLPSLVTRFSEVFSVDPSLFGAVFSLQFICYAAASSAAAYITSRGFRALEPLLVISLLVSAACLALIGHVPTFWALILVMMVIGTCGGFVEANGTSLLAHYDTSSGGRLVHLSQFFYCIGAFTAPLVIALLLHRGSALPIIGYSTGALTFLVFLTVYALLNHPARPAEHTEEAEEAADNSGFDWVFFLFLSMMFLYVVVEISAVSWFPYYMEQRFNIPSAPASLSLTVFWTGLGISRLVYTFINAKRLVLHTGLCIIGIMISLVLIQAGILSYELLLPFVLLFGYSCGPIWPLLIELCKKTYRRKHHIMYLISAGSVGALTGPSLTSLLFRHYGISSMLLILLVYTLVMGTVLVILKKQLR